MIGETIEFPGFIDVHVHFRDPGVPEAETTATGLAAARRGGFAAVVTMPNTAPAADGPDALAYQRARAAEAGSGFPVLLPSAAITLGRGGRDIVDFEALAAAGAAFFTDDGSYVTDGQVMERAMRRIAALGMTVSQHALPPSVGVIRDCALARRLGLPIVPEDAEADAIRRDIALCRVTGCPLHIQHLSTAAGVALLRDARREGLPVTAEATPHHLLFCCDDLTADDASFKMAPPLGNSADRAALREAVKEGLCMFATDHAPHPADCKNVGFRKSANGIVGLETAVAVTYDVMVVEEGMAVADWARAWWDLPRRILAPSCREALARLSPTRIVTGSPHAVRLEDFAGRARNCPYGGRVYSTWPEVQATQ